MLTDFMTYFDVTDVFSCSIKLHGPGRFRVSSECTAHASQMTEAKMTPSSPRFGAKIFDFRSSTVPILTLKNTLLHFESAAVFRINRSRIYSRIVLKLTMFEDMLHIEKIA